MGLNSYTLLRNYWQYIASGRDVIFLFFKFNFVFLGGWEDYNGQPQTQGVECIECRTGSEMRDERYSKYAIRNSQKIIK